MTDIQLYVLFKYKDSLPPFLTPRITKLILKDSIGFEPDNLNEVIEILLSSTPKPKFIAFALRDMGFTQSASAKLIGVSQATLSQHLRNPLDYEWVNHAFRKYLEELREQ